MKQEISTMVEELVSSMQADRPQDVPNSEAQGNTYATQFRVHRKHSRIKRFFAAAAALAAFATTYALILPAITMESSTKCGIEEHTHTSACYVVQKNPVCDYAKNPSLDPTHAHSDDCYAESAVLACALPEHTHLDSCYRNEEGNNLAAHSGKSVKSSQVQQSNNAEDASVTSNDGEANEDSATSSTPQSQAPSTPLVRAWELTFEQLDLNKDKAHDIVVIANSQIGPQESATDTVEAADKQVRGATLYGEWYGDPYIDWNSVFVSFCLNYSGVDGVKASDASSLQRALQELGLYVDGYSILPLKGNVAFVDTTDDGTPDTVGIIVDATVSTVSIAEGDVEGAVVVNEYNILSTKLVGYASLSTASTSETPLCLTPEHTHTDDCLDEGGLIFCAFVSEHNHTDDCYNIEKMNNEFAGGAQAAQAAGNTANSIANVQSANMTSVRNSPLLLSAGPMSALKSGSKAPNNNPISMMPDYTNVYEDKTGYRDTPDKNVYLRALARTGYQVQKRSDYNVAQGTIGLTLPSVHTDKEGNFEKNFRSPYWNQTNSSDYLGAQADVTTGLKPKVKDLADGKHFDVNSLSCASFASYVFWNYFEYENIYIAHMLSYPIDNPKDPHGNWLAAGNWRHALDQTRKNQPPDVWTHYDFKDEKNKWPAYGGKEASAVRDGKLKNGENIPIGTILYFYPPKGASGTTGHVAIYAGRFPAYKTEFIQAAPPYAGTIQAAKDIDSNLKPVFEYYKDKDRKEGYYVEEETNEDGTDAINYYDYVYDVGDSYGPRLVRIPENKTGEGIELEMGGSPKKYPTPVLLNVSKKNEKGQPLQGARFKLYQYRYDATPGTGNIANPHGSTAYPNGWKVNDYQEPGVAESTYRFAYDVDYTREDINSAAMEKQLVGEIVTDEQGQGVFVLSEDAIPDAKTISFTISRNNLELVSSKATLPLPQFQLVEVEKPQKYTTEIPVSLPGTGESPLYDVNGKTISLPANVKELNLYIDKNNKITKPDGTQEAKCYLYEGLRPEYLNIGEIVEQKIMGEVALAAAAKNADPTNPNLQYFDIKTYVESLSANGYANFFTLNTLFGGVNIPDPTTNNYEVKNYSGSGFQVKKQDSSGTVMSGIIFNAVWIGGLDSTPEEREAYVRDKKIDSRSEANDLLYYIDQETYQKRKHFTATTGQNGIADFTVKEPGYYRLYEMTLDKGIPHTIQGNNRIPWSLNDEFWPQAGQPDYYPVKVPYTDVVVPLGDTPTVTFNVVNESQQLRIRKVGEGFDPTATTQQYIGLTGAEFGIRETGTNRSVTLGPTDNTGYSKYMGIFPGEVYEVYETKSPQGYTSYSVGTQATEYSPVHVGTLRVVEEQDKTINVTFEKDPGFAYNVVLTKEQSTGTQASGSWTLEVENKLEWNYVALTKVAEVPGGSDNLKYLRQKKRWDDSNTRDVSYEEDTLDPEAVYFEVYITAEGDNKGERIPWHRISTNKYGKIDQYPMAFQYYAHYFYQWAAAYGMFDPELTVGASPIRVGLRPNDTIVFGPLPPDVTIKYKESGRYHILTPRRKVVNNVDQTNFDLLNAFYWPARYYNLNARIPDYDYRDNLVFSSEGLNTARTVMPKDKNGYISIEPNTGHRYYLKNALTLDEPYRITKKMLNGNKWPEGGVTFHLYHRGANLPISIKGVDGKPKNPDKPYETLPANTIGEFTLKDEGDYLEYWPLDPQYRCYTNIWEVDITNSVRFPQENLLAWEKVPSEYSLFSEKAYPIDIPSSTAYWLEDFKTLCETAKIPIPSRVWNIYPNLRYDIEVPTSYGVDPKHHWNKYRGFRYENTVTNATTHVGNNIFYNDKGTADFIGKKSIQSKDPTYDFKFPFYVNIYPDTNRGLSPTDVVKYKVYDKNDNEVKGSGQQELTPGKASPILLEEDQYFKIKDLPVGTILDVAEGAPISAFYPDTGLQSLQNWQELTFQKYELNRAGETYEYNQGSALHLGLVEGPNELICYNRLKFGSLKIIKKLDGDEYDEGEFKFRLTFKLYSEPSSTIFIQADKSDGTRRWVTLRNKGNNSSYFTLKPDEELTLDGIPVGTRYVVDEIRDTSNTKRPADTKIKRWVDGTIEETKTDTSTGARQVALETLVEEEFINKTYSGSLEVVKKIEEPYAADDPEKEFPFWIWIQADKEFLPDKSNVGAKICTGEDDTEGVPVEIKVSPDGLDRVPYEFKLKPEQRLVIPKLPEGTRYEVGEGTTEPDPTGKQAYVPVKPEGMYSTSIKRYVNNDHQLNADVKSFWLPMDKSDPITRDNRNTVEFTNKRLTGSLKIDKKVRGTLQDPETSFDFNIVFQPNEYLETVSPVIGKKSDGSVLEVNPGETSTFTLKRNENIVFDGIPVGTEYTITETTEGFLTAIGNLYGASFNRTTNERDPDFDCKSVTDTIKLSPQGYLCYLKEFWNTPAFGGIEISKNVIDPGGVVDLNASFSFILLIEENKPLLTSTNPVKARVYDVKGKPIDDGVDVYPGTPLHFSLKDGESLRIPDSALPVGTKYHVKEIKVSGIAPTINYSVGDIHETIKKERIEEIVLANWRLSAGGYMIPISLPNVLRFDNGPEYGQLDITKRLIDPGNTVSPNTEFSFELTLEGNSPLLAIGETVVAKKTDGVTETLDSVTVGRTKEFTLKDGETLSLEGLPEGVNYTVKELTLGYGTQVKRYLNGEKVGTITASESSGSIVAASLVKEEFENSVGKGGLDIIKRLKDMDGLSNPQGVFQFKLLIHPVARDLPKGTVLTAQKLPADADTPSLGTETITVGTEASFTLKEDERLSLTDLPAGTAYKVWEMGVGYDTEIVRYQNKQKTGTITANEITGIIVADIPVQEEFNNSPTRGNLEILKSLEMPNGKPIEEAPPVLLETDFEFVLHIDPNDEKGLVAGTQIEATKTSPGKPIEKVHLTVGEDSRFTLRHDQKLVLTNILPLGTTYRVSEVATQGVTFTGKVIRKLDGVKKRTIQNLETSNTITVDGVYQEHFVNTPLVNLKVVKRVEALPGYEVDAKKQFNFVLSVPYHSYYAAKGLVADKYNAAGDKVESYNLTFPNRRSFATLNFTLAKDEYLTLNGLLIDTKCTVNETGGNAGYKVTAETQRESFEGTVLNSDFVPGTPLVLSDKEITFIFNNVRANTRVSLVKKLGFAPAGGVGTGGGVMMPPVAAPGSGASGGLLGAATKTRDFDFYVSIKPDGEFLQANQLVTARKYKCFGEPGTATHETEDLGGIQLLVGGLTPVKLGVYDDKRVYELIDIATLPAGTEVTLYENKVGGYLTTYTTTVANAKRVEDISTLGAVLQLRDSMNWMTFYNDDSKYSLEVEKLVIDKKYPDAIYELKMRISSIRDLPEFRSYTATVTDGEGNPVRGDDPANQQVVLDTNGKSILQPDGTFTANVDETLTLFIRDGYKVKTDKVIPVGALYNIRETEGMTFIPKITVTNPDGTQTVRPLAYVQGRIGGETKLLVENTEIAPYELPKSGGIGDDPKGVAGIIMLVLAGIFALAVPLRMRAHAANQAAPSFRGDGFKLPFRGRR